MRKKSQTSDVCWDKIVCIQSSQVIINSDFKKKSVSGPIQILGQEIITQSVEHQHTDATANNQSQSNSLLQINERVIFRIKLVETNQKNGKSSSGLHFSKNFSSAADTSLR